jgi:hypothetical protein
MTTVGQEFLPACCGAELQSNHLKYNRKADAIDVMLKKNPLQVMSHTFMNAHLAWAAVRGHPSRTYPLFSPDRSACNRVVDVAHRG